MYDNQLRPYFDGRILANQSAMQDPAVRAALAAMSMRNFEPLPTPLARVWNISDRH